MSGSSNSNSRDAEALQLLTDQLVECIHCGLCLEACPTYGQILREEDSPRGRIYLMRSVSEGHAGIDPSVLKHLDVCLGCRACETACPSGVRYGFLLEHTRTHIEEHGRRPLVSRLLRRVMMEVFTHSGLMALAMFGASLPGRFLRKPPSAPGGLVTKLFGSHEQGGTLFLENYPPLRPQRLKGFTPAEGQRRLKVALLEGCVMPVLFPEVNQATVRVLSALGCDVTVPAGQGCCGALHVHNGYSSAAAKMALRNIEAFEKAQCDVIAINSAGCGSTLEEYANLFQPGTEEHRRAEAFSAKVKDVSEVIVDLLPESCLGALDVTVTYHDACHLAHGQKIRTQPRMMLTAIAGLKLVELEESDHCCGSAGVYSFAQPGLATQLQSRKVANIEATGAEIVATGNPGCQMWIRSGLKKAGSRIRALHPIEILDMAIQNGRQAQHKG